MPWGSSQPRAAAIDCTRDDISKALIEIEKVNKAYCNLLDHIRPICRAKGKDEERVNLLLRRKELKEAFIRSKQTVRALILQLPDNETLIIQDAETRLKSLQEEFRSTDLGLKELNVQVDRAALGLRGSGESSDGKPESTVRMAASVGAGALGNRGNDAALRGALEIEAVTTAKLKAGLAVVNTAQAVAVGISETLAQDREKLSRISAGLDGVQSELVMSQRLLTTLIKRFATDKVIIGLTFLVVVGIIGIIIYSVVNPGQTTFSVPDIIKPPTSN